MELSVLAKVLLDSCDSGGDSDGAVTAAAQATDGYILLSCRGAVRFVPWLFEFYP